MRYIARRLTLLIVGTLSCKCLGASSTVSVAAEVGITSHSLAVAGFAPLAGESMLAQIDLAQELRQSLQQQHLLADQASAAVTAAAEQLSIGPGAQALQQYAAATSALQAIESQIDELQQELFAVATEGFPAELVQRLVIWRDGAAHTVPEEFRVADRTDEQWTSLKVALRAESRANRLGEQLEEGHAQLLAQIRSEPAVAMAQQNIVMHLAAMNQTFQSNIN